MMYYPVAPIVALEDIFDAADALPFPTNAELVMEIRSMCSEVFDMDRAMTDARMALFDYAKAASEVAE